MVKEIPLSQGKVALVDDGDYADLSQFNWYAERVKLKNHPDQFYAVRRVSVGAGRQIRAYMHRVITSCPEGQLPDHIDGDSLNNQRGNLRIATDSTNQANRMRLLPAKSSEFRGVTLHRKTGRWQAAVKVNGKNLYLGLFDTEVEAAAAYDESALVHFGEFARLNFPERQVMTDPIPPTTELDAIAERLPNLVLDPERAAALRAAIARPRPPATPEEIAQYAALPTDLDPAYASMVALGLSLHLREQAAEYEAKHGKDAVAA